MGLSELSSFNSFLLYSKYFDGFSCPQIKLQFLILILKTILNLNRSYRPILMNHYAAYDNCNQVRLFFLISLPAFTVIPPSFKNLYFTSSTSMTQRECRFKSATDQNSKIDSSLLAVHLWVNHFSPLSLVPKSVLF